MAKKEEEKVVDLYDILMDEDNCEPITLTDDKNNEIKFEQVAIVPLEEKMYVILKPLDNMEGVADDEAIVFEITKNDKETVLLIEEDEKIGEKVFEAYYKLIDEAEEK